MRTLAYERKYQNKTCGGVCEIGKKRLEEYGITQKTCTKCSDGYDCETSNIENKTIGYDILECRDPSYYCVAGIIKRVIIEVS